MAVLRVGTLAPSSLAAAAQFHADVLPAALAALKATTAQGNLVLVFQAADHTHTAWRRAAVQELARAHAPTRVNALAGGGAVEISAACDYLAHAPGVTGQLLALDGTGAAAMLYQG